MTVRLAAAFLLLQLLCQVLLTVECRREIPSGYIEYPEDNTAYKVSTDRVTWNEARDRCIAEGAHLAVATTVPKMKHIVNNRNTTNVYAIFTGVYRAPGTSDWVRIDNGQTVTSLPWTDYSSGKNANCAIINSFSGGWISNWFCSRKFLFVCEISTL